MTEENYLLSTYSLLLSIHISVSTYFAFAPLLVLENHLEGCFDILIIEIIPSRTFHSSELLILFKASPGSCWKVRNQAPLSRTEIRTFCCVPHRTTWWTSICSDFRLYHVLSASVMLVLEYRFFLPIPEKHCHYFRNQFNHHQEKQTCNGAKEWNLTCSSLRLGFIMFSSFSDEMGPFLCFSVDLIFSAISLQSSTDIFTICGCNTTFINCLFPKFISMHLQSPSC
ncbi:uncharacterized protein LOC116211000 [Punica granatum]|uniref:Uncharacterized protein LOC116211000 n=1 Tax=Punica granatum TaxID=22663 RepID=A0A6P8DZV4_PUNGR|nr:uncharacterized protein LOC116211000 [Punica granatum]